MYFYRQSSLKLRNLLLFCHLKKKTLSWKLFRSKIYCQTAVFWVIEVDIAIFEAYQLCCFVGREFENRNIWQRFKTPIVGAQVSESVFETRHHRLIENETLLFWYFVQNAWMISVKLFSLTVKNMFKAMIDQAFKLEVCYRQRAEEKKPEKSLSTSFWEGQFQNLQMNCSIWQRWLS